MGPKRRKKDDDPEIPPLTPTTTTTPTGSRYALRSRPLIPTTPTPDCTNADDDSNFVPSIPTTPTGRRMASRNRPLLPPHPELHYVDEEIEDELIPPSVPPTTLRSRRKTTTTTPTPPSVPPTTLRSKRRRTSLLSQLLEEEEEINRIQTSDHHSHHNSESEDDEDGIVPLAPPNILRPRRRHPSSDSEGSNFDSEDEDRENETALQALQPHRLMLTWKGVTTEYEVLEGYWDKDNHHVHIDVIMSHEEVVGGNRQMGGNSCLQEIGLCPDPHLVPAIQPAPPPPPPEDAEPFRLPRLGTLLRGVFDAVKTHLTWGESPGQTDANMGESQEFLTLMESLKWDGDVVFGRGSTRMTPIKGKKGSIRVKWQNEALWFNGGSQPGWRQLAKKCSMCWKKAKDTIVPYCLAHSLKPREIMLLRDTNNPELCILICHPSLRMSSHDSQSINEVVQAYVRKKRNYPTLAGYFRTRRRRYPNFEIDMRWSYPTTLSEANYNTYTISTSIMVFFHNNAFHSTLPKIKLLMKLVDFEHANWTEVGEILKKNGFKFKLTPNTSRLLPSEMFPKTVDIHQPHTYQGHDGMGGVYDGGIIALQDVHTSGASRGHTKGVNRPLAKYTQNVVNLYQDLTEESQEEIQNKTYQVEFMGHLATIMGTILQQSFKGHPMYPLTKQLNHYDEVFDYSIFVRLFRLKTGCEILVEREGNGIPISNCKPQFVF